MAFLNPHFDLPFRFSGSCIASVEQDSYDDIANCVESVLRTPQGWRNDAPDIGNPVEPFDMQPLNNELIKDSIQTQEPRARVLVSQQADIVDSLIDYIKVTVETT